MTIALLAKWGDQPPGTLYSTDAGTEAAMIAANVATASLGGAVAWAPQIGSPTALYIGPWVGRPAAGVVPGAEICITDFPAGGRSSWYSDGTYWRPVNGCVKIAIRSGTVAAPITTFVQQTASWKYVLPVNMLLPIGMLFPGVRISGEFETIRVSTGGTPIASAARIYIGPNNSAADGICYAASGNGTGAGAGYRGVPSVSIQPSGANALAVLTNGLMATGTTGSIGDIAINVAVDNYISIGHAGDLSDTSTYGLLAYSLYLEA